MYAVSAFSGSLALAMGWQALELTNCVRFRGGLLFFRFGRFGGSFYIANRRAPK